jgi:hypothetical protein
MKEKGKVSLMRISNTAKYALGVTAAAAILAGCSSAGSQMATPAAGGSAGMSAKGQSLHSLIPANLLHPAPQQTLSRLAPQAKGGGKAGIYASEFYGSEIFGYKASGKGSPTCTISGVSYVNDIGSDSKADVIDPDGGSRSVIVFAPNCGKSLGTISDSYGQPADATSDDASKSTIVVGNIFDNSDTPASISTGTLKGGLTSNLTNSKIYELAGVAEDTKGNCWGSAINSSDEAALVYFKGCKGGGALATGFMNSFYGGLDIDSKGNLVAVDLTASAVYVYSGCDPKCTKVAGPLTLHGESVFGKVNKTSKMYAAGDFANGTIDLYKYDGKSLKYTSSISNGLSESLEPEGVAYAPRSSEGGK